METREASTMNKKCVDNVNADLEAGGPSSEHGDNENMMLGSCSSSCCSRDGQEPSPMQLSRHPNKSLDANTSSPCDIMDEEDTHSQEGRRGDWKNGRVPPPAVRWVAALLMLLLLAACSLRLFTTHHTSSSSFNTAADKEDHTNPPLRVQVSYQGEQGLALIQECADEIISSSSSTNEAVVIASKTCMEYLSEQRQRTSLDDNTDHFVSYIEEDYPTQALGDFSHGSLTLPEEEDLSHLSKERSIDPTKRKALKEVTPWGIEMIQADQLQMGSDPVTVCIADTGLAVNHTDFQASAYINITGEDYILNDGQVWKWDEDRSGHGTHLAGILSASENNGLGVIGAGPIHLHIVRALDDEARGHASDLQRSIESCVNAGAKVISLSIGMATLSTTMDRMINHVVDDLGIMIVAAIGNTGSDAQLYPAAHPKVIAVGAVREDGSRWFRSSYGAQMELAAHGVQVLSTFVSSSMVRTRDFQHHASYVDGSSHSAVNGVLRNCGKGLTRCRRNRNGICLLRLESGNGSSDKLDQMLKNCARSKAQGAIVYNAQGSSFDSGVVHSSDLSVVWVPRVTAEHLLQNYVGDEVTIGDFDSDGVEYTYREMSGTSFAAPHVAAAAALVWSHFGDTCTNHQIRYALAHTAFNPTDPLGVGCDEKYGYGIVKAKDAYDFLVENDCSTWRIPEPSTGGCTTAELPILFNESW